MSGGTRIAVLVSGGGTNLQAFIDAIHRGPSPGTIVGVLANRQCLALERAQTAKIAGVCMPPEPSEDRADFDRRVQNQLDSWHPDLIILAGFMRILSPQFVAHFAGKMLNVHPSLLPAYKGLHTHQRVLDAGERWHGTSVHFVTAELDGGPVIAQARLEISPADDASTLSARIQALEHTLYPRVADWFCRGRLQCRNGQVIVDDTTLSEGILYASPQDLAESAGIPLPHAN